MRNARDGDEPARIKSAKIQFAEVGEAEKRPDRRISCIEQFSNGSESWRGNFDRGHRGDRAGMRAINSDEKVGTTALISVDTLATHVKTPLTKFDLQDGPPSPPS